MLTESPNPRTANVDRLSTSQILELMNDEDATIAHVVRQTLPEIAKAVDTIVQRIQQGGRLIYVGAGTSGRLGVLDAVECVPTFSTDPGLVVGLIAGGETALTQAVEGAEDNIEAGRNDLLALNLTSKDVVVGIAASGRTPYVISALETANTIGAATIAISCNAPAPILNVAQIKIAVLVGPEIITGSTRLKSGTAQKLILNMLSTASMIRLGKVYGNRMVDVKVTNQKLAGRACRIIAEVAGVSEQEASRLLEQTGNQVKPAIVMALLDVSAGEARALLDKAQGMLGLVIGDNE